MDPIKYHQAKSKKPSGQRPCKHACAGKQGQKINLSFWLKATKRRIRQGSFENIAFEGASIDILKFKIQCQNAMQCRKMQGRKFNGRNDN